MLKFYMHAVLISEIIAAIFGTIYYFKYKNTPFKYFLIVLWLIVITEIIGAFYIEWNIYYMDENGVKYNLGLYNLLYIIVYPIFYYIYYKALETKKYRNAIKIFFLSFIVISIINWIFIQDFLTEYSKYPDIIGSLFLTICVIFYFIELLQSEKVIRFHRSVSFWLSVGLLVYYTSIIPFTVVVNNYALADKALQKMFLINHILAIAMYSVFTFGFIWSKKE
ncbi:hypothetical protein [Aureibaculum conchae]|uniref:hypothetical protein n=1 Tax=Aureibaculum sp. 2308TA14-22 TaxID=3108392 RepID=UPI003395E2F6